MRNTSIHPMASQMSRRNRWARVGVLALGLVAVVQVGPALSASPKVAAEPSKPPAAQVPDVTKQRVVEAYGRLPLSFEANQGQTDPQIKFLARGSGYTLFLTPTEAVLALLKPQDEHSATRHQPTAAPGRVEKRDAVVLRIRLAGTNPHPEVAGLGELPGKSHYYIGNDPTKWRTNIPSYAKVRYQDVYPGVDLIYYGNRQQLEYDFVVAPGADPETITLAFQSAERLEIDQQGDLVLHTAAGEIRLHKPFVYQKVDGVKHELAGGYVLKDKDQIGFQVGAYDRSKPLIIDPVLSYSTTVAGSKAEEVLGIAVDGSGNAYLAGWTFPWSGPSMSDAFVATLNPTGSALVYVTYFGGSGVERANSIAADSSGNAYVTGITFSSDFPLGLGIGFPRGGSSAFVTRLHSFGAVDQTVALDGNGYEEGVAIAADPNPFGHVYVTGYTTSTDFVSMSGVIQNTNAGDHDAFLVVLFSGTLGLRYHTYLGGSGPDVGEAIAADASGNAYVTGGTGSTNFPTRASPSQNILQSKLRGPGDAFVAKVDPSSAFALRYSTSLGGTGGDDARGIAVDASGNAYVTGFTHSYPAFPSVVNDFPTTSGAFQTTSPDALGGTNVDGDAFVAKLNSYGSALVYSTYLGGSKGDVGSGIAVDGSGNAYVTGSTTSTNFPTVNPIQPPTSTVGGFGDAFVAKLNPSGSALIYSTYLGGSDTDGARGIAVDGTGNAYVMGDTASNDFPTVNPLQPNGPRGLWRSFVAKINAADTATTAPGQTATVSTAPGVPGEAGVSATLTNNGAFTGDVTVTAENLSTNPGTKNIIDVGGGYVDLKVTGADSSDTLTAKFYYPTTVPDAFANLLYFNGSFWTTVLSSGQTTPALDTTDNLDGTISGGRFTVVFDNTSTPKITELTGTPFTVAVTTPLDGIVVLISQVGGLDLNSGQKNSLTSKLKGAQQSLERGHLNSAIHQLNAFINEVQASKRSGLLNSAAADSLIAIAKDIINLI